MADNKAKSTLVYCGSFQPQFIGSLAADMDVAGIGDGIYVYALDEESGALSLHSNMYGVINPGQLCCDEAGKRLYAASDTSSFINWEAGSGGGVYAFCIEADGRLKMLDGRSSCGVRAVGVALSQSGKYLVVINEGSGFCTTEFIKNEQGRYEANIRRDEGCVVLFRVGAAGFEKVCDRYVLPEGVPAHPNTLFIDKDNYLYVGNKGGETLSILRIDEETETLAPISVTALECAPGGFALHPHLPVFYMSCPQNGQVRIYRFDENRRQVALWQPVFEEEASNPGPLCMAADGRTLYAADTERGEIKVYGVSGEGKLVLLQRVQEGISFPESGSVYALQLSPCGGWLLVSNMKANCILALPVAAGGTLGAAVETAAKTPTGLLAQ